MATCGAKFQTAEDKQQFDELTGRMFSRRERASDKDEAMFNAVMAKIDRWGQCVRGKKVGFRDAMAPPEVGIVPQRTPQAASRANCPPERLRLAQSFAARPSWEYLLRALELCPAEMCPSLGRRITMSGIPRLKNPLAAARLCPQL